MSYEIVKRFGGIPWIQLVHFGFQSLTMQGVPAFRVYPETVASWDAARYEMPRENGFGFNEFRDFVRCASPDVIMI